VRAHRSLERITLIETIRRDHDMTASIEQPSIEQGRLLLVAGLVERVTYGTVARIPFLWQRFTPYIGHVPGETGSYAYGVKFNSDSDGFDYMAGLEVISLDGLPNDLRGVRIPQQKYAVFVHRGHISTIRSTMHAIWSDALPKSGLEPVDSPEFERYGDDFDPSNGNGNVEIFIPLKG
jgi:AraC family transcriptional regulator